jgi:hypothetical protein
MMRKLLLASSAVFLLVGGAAFAGQGGYGGGKGGDPSTSTTTTVVAVPFKNATSVGTGNSSATTGGTAVSAELNSSANTTSSDNTANSDNTAVELTKNLSDVGNTALEFTRTDVKIDVKLATSTNNGSVDGTLYINDPTCGCDDSRDSSKTGALTGDASMSNVNGGQGILTAQQNTGVNALQQSSVALGSVVTGGSSIGGSSGF